MVYQHGNELQASRLIGTTVANGANSSVGNISELVLSKDGRVAAVVIGVGGSSRLRIAKDNNQQDDGLHHREQG